jgi:DNA-binding IclR family transcriptional regulator
MAKEEGEEEPGGTGRLGALRKGLAVFDMFDVDRTTVTVVEIARHLNLHKSSASRIAANLMLAGFLTPAPTGGYRLSAKLTRLGAIAAADTHLTSVSAEHMRALVAEVGETCHVGVLEGNEAVTVALVDGSYSVRLHSWVGKRSLAHSTAMGKVLLSELDDDVLGNLFPDGRLPVRTEHTVDNLADLKAQLAEVRSSGFAFDNEELELGLRCVAAPIRDFEGRIVGALTVAGAASRLTMTGRDYYISKVMASAADISADLGSYSRGIASTG